MQHHNSKRKFGREAKERGALLTSLCLSLIEHEHLITTEAKAKSLRPAIEKMITAAKSGKREQIRLLSARLDNNAKATKKLFTVIAPRFKERRGGYTRITKLGMRSGRGDASPLAMIEFISDNSRTK